MRICEKGEGAGAWHSRRWWPFGMTSEKEIGGDEWTSGRVTSDRGGEGPARLESRWTCIRVPGLYDQYRCRYCQRKTSGR